MLLKGLGIILLLVASFVPQLVQLELTGLVKLFKFENIDYVQQNQFLLKIGIIGINLLLVLFIVVLVFIVKINKLILGFKQFQAAIQKKYFDAK